MATLQKLDSQISDLEQEVARRQAKEDKLKEEINQLPAAEHEADRQDREAHNKQHAEWLDSGKSGPKPRFEQPRLWAVQERIRKLPRFVWEAEHKKWQATEKLERLRAEEQREKARPSADRADELRQERERLNAEIAKEASIADRYLGAAKRHEIAMYEAMNEANRLGGILERRE